LLSGLIGFQLGVLVHNSQLDRPPSLKEVQLRGLEMYFDQLMDTLAARGNNVLKMSMLVRPGRHELLFIEIQPDLHYVVNFSRLAEHVFPLELLNGLIVSCLISCTDDLMLQAKELVLIFKAVGVVIILREAGQTVAKDCLICVLTAQQRDCLRKTRRHSIHTSKATICENHRRGGCTAKLIH
jgi:hypothetical protein